MSVKEEGGFEVCVVKISYNHTWMHPGSIQNQSRINSDSIQPNPDSIPEVSPSQAASKVITNHLNMKFFRPITRHIIRGMPQRARFAAKQLRMRSSSIEKMNLGSS